MARQANPFVCRFHHSTHDPNGTGGISMRRLCSVILLATLGTAGSAAAGGDVCLFDEDNNIVFHLQKPKLPKSIGTSTAVVGTAQTSGAPAASPVAGAITRVGESDLILGLTRYGPFCLITSSVDSSLAGSFGYDCNLDGANDEISTVSLVECGSP
jgi:hypothetical protein